MSENFRCDKTVVDFVNLVSDALFPNGGIPYTAEDALVFGKGGDTCVPAEICLVEKPLLTDEELSPELRERMKAYMAQYCV